MEKIKVAIVGYGNIGKYSLDAVLAASDMECVGVVRRSGNAGEYRELQDFKVVSDIRDLGKVDVAILATPSRSVKENAEKYLKMGISTVDSFDIHSQIWDLRKDLDTIAKEGNAVSIISAGWDPGSGPGRSRGHSVVAKSKEGVVDALSLTIPKGTGLHRRMVYVQLEEGADFDQVTADILADPYFSSDETHVIRVGSVDDINDLGHGVAMARKGVSGKTHNQLFKFSMKINNPALTGQVLVSCARAAVKQKPGCYTMIEIPVIDLLEGEPEELIKHLV